MKSIEKILNNNLIFGLMFLWLTFLILTHLWPSSFWLKVESVKAGPAIAGQSVPMVVVRDIKSPFLGTWNVTVRKWGVNGWTTYCVASDTSKYDLGSELPNELTLDWWTGKKCPSLVEGRYIINTVWHIDTLVPVLPKKVVEIDSDIFIIFPENSHVR